MMLGNWNMALFEFLIIIIKVLFYNYIINKVALFNDYVVVTIVVGLYGSFIASGTVS
jgi:hypothetical protein